MEYICNMRILENTLLFLSLVCSVFFGYSLHMSLKNKPTVQQPELRVAEMVVGIQPDSVFGGYKVEVRRLELVESSYWIHTDKKYSIGQVNRIYVPSNENLTGSKFGFLALK